MIEFITLLLGLIIGPHEVEVAVGAEVHSVEWILDGESVAKRNEPPWKAQINFGADLRPQRLVTVAFDRKGTSLDRAEQMINYIRSNHEVVVVLESDPEEAPNAKTNSRPPRRGRIVTKGVLGHGPTDYSLRFDSEPLSVSSGRFELPPYDVERPHAIEVEVMFSDGAQAKTETTFGGGMGEEVTTALSAIAVSSRKGRPWSGDEVKGWIRKIGKPLSVFQTRADEGQMVVVRDEGLDMAMRRNMPFPSIGRSRIQGRRTYHLSAVSPTPIAQPVTTFRETALGEVKSSQGLLLSLVSPSSVYGFPRVADGQQDIWGALAIAGRAAASGNMPRVVILLLSEQPVRDSGLSPESVLSYLESIHVPLLIWAPTRKPLKDLGFQKMANAYAGPKGLGSVVHNASAWIDSQTMIWVEGVHLPTEVELVPSHKKAHFVGLRSNIE